MAGEALTKEQDHFGIFEANWCILDLYLYICFFIPCRFFVCGVACLLELEGLDTESARAGQEEQGTMATG